MKNARISQYKYMDPRRTAFSFEKGPGPDEPGGPRNCGPPVLGLGK